MVTYLGVYEKWKAKPCEDTLDELANSLPIIFESEGHDVFVSFRANSKSIICCFSGEMDSGVSEQLDQHFQKLFSRIKDIPLMFDLREVQGISGTFMKFCLNVAQMTSPKQLTIIHASPGAMDMLKSAGLPKVIEVWSD